MAQCVTLAGSNLYLVLDGSVLNAPIMTCVVSVTMVINIIYGTDFTESQHLEVTSRLKFTNITHNYDRGKWLKTIHIKKVKELWNICDKNSYSMRIFSYKQKLFKLLYNFIFCFFVGAQLNLEEKARRSQPGEYFQGRG